MGHGTQDPLAELLEAAPHGSVCPLWLLGQAAWSRSSACTLTASACPASKGPPISAACRADAPFPVGLPFPACSEQTETMGRPWRGQQGCLGFTTSKVGCNTELALEKSALGSFHPTWGPGNGGHCPAGLRAKLCLRSHGSWQELQTLHTTNSSPLRPAHLHAPHPPGLAHRNPLRAAPHFSTHPPTDGCSSGAD